MGPPHTVSAPPGVAHGCARTGSEGDDTRRHPSPFVPGHPCRGLHSASAVLVNIVRIGVHLSFKIVRNNKLAYVAKHIISLGIVASSSIRAYSLVVSISVGRTL